MSSRFFRMCLVVGGALAGQNYSVAAPMDAACVRTQAIGLRVATHENAEEQMLLPQTAGYRITKIIRDPLLHQQWAMAVSCGHPERPSIAIPLPEQRLDATLSPSTTPTDSHGSNPFPIVHAGDVVQLVAREPNLRMEIAGRAEQSGALGSKVRVRSLNSGFDIGRDQTFVGIVRGPGKIEIQP